MSRTRDAGRSREISSEISGGAGGAAAGRGLKEEVEEAEQQEQVCEGMKVTHLSARALCGSVESVSSTTALIQFDDPNPEPGVLLQGPEEACTAINACMAPTNTTMDTARAGRDGFAAVGQAETGIFKAVVMAACRSKFCWFPPPPAKAAVE